MGQFGNQPDFGTKGFPVVIGTTDVSRSALYVGTGGNIEVVLVGSPGTPVVFTNIPDGSFLPCIVSSIVVGANTTVTNVVAIQ
jgi:hypothetical protein